MRIMLRRHRSTTVALAAGAALALTACGGASDETGTGSEAAGSGETIQIEDDHGAHEVPADPQSIVATDNRSFRTLEAFGVELTAAPLGLARESAYGSQDLIDLGSHQEPNLEAIVEAQPDVVINGQRFAQYYGDIEALLPEGSVILEWDQATRDPETFFDGLREKTEQLGALFGEEEAAQGLVDDLDAAAARVEAAYDGEASVMGVLTSGGTINYAAPGDGRSVGPLFTEFGLVPALESEAEDESHGDDISVEAIAEANPEWMLVLDRDAMNSDEPDYQPAAELIEESPALQNVPAVQEGNIVYAPDNMYLTEDIQAYTEFLNSFADALESQQ
ncbi:siderophore ABC transporter substrate-binding protein [Sediminivirga luteola]|uniref:Iron ABC transporter substrate-binding protein n=1 Tax=Sediminivirga luteola TaxID=1774748 RepID=A0A8J2XJZ5_9MICO|nr:ABC transporter substrate-binding protein [Sediminivirga luteola]GGA23917.1 iron ABC transporter substrate-binding protein [Sediminivirga luteola]